MIAARPIAATIAALVSLAAVVLPGAAGAQEEQQIPSIELRGALNPAEADWVGHALDAAVDSGAPFAIVRLDTPGGLDAAADEIVYAIRSAPIPVVVYVSPGGAKVENRGAAIVDAADVAAMAPGTTLEFEGNDLGENTAQKQGRIEMIAADQDRLLDKLDGWQVSGPKAMALSTGGAEIDDQGMTIPFQVLEALVDPNVAFLLLLVGLLGLALEALAPGTIIPGALGVACLVLGLVGAIQLPVAAVGVALLLAGAAMIVTAMRLPAARALGVVGIAALIGGGLSVFDTRSEQVAVSPSFVVGVGAVLGLAAVFVAPGTLEARRPGRAHL